jgi:hypothetical protein
MDSVDSHLITTMHVFAMRIAAADQNIYESLTLRYPAPQLRITVGLSHVRCRHPKTSIMVPFYPLRVR